MKLRWNKSDLDDFKKAKRERLKLYSKADDILYDMCKRWPNHTDIGIVQAKVRIIGRVYAAGLRGRERKIDQRAYTRLLPKPSIKIEHGSIQRLKQSKDSKHYRKHHMRKYYPFMVIW